MATPAKKAAPKKRTPRAKHDFETLLDMATRAYPDDEEKQEKFVNLTMTKLGHKASTQWADAEEAEESDENGEEERDELIDDEEEEEEVEEEPKGSRGRSYWRK